MTMTKKQRKRASSSNRRGMAGIALVVEALLCVMLLQSHRLEAKNAAYAQQIAQLNEAIELENVRAEEIEKMPEYTHTKEYVEKVAREKFGLVYEDEMIFRAAD